MKLRVLAFVALCLAHPSLAKLPPSPSLGSTPQGLTVADWTQIRAEYERHRHGMFPDRNGFVARSFEQQWLARFDGRGFTVKPDEGVWSWGLELVGVTGKAQMKAEINRLTYHWSANLDEWFLQDKRGLEHGFTLRAPQEIRLAVRGGLRPQTAGTGVEFVDGSGTAHIRYTGLAAWDADGQSLPAQMKVEGEVVRLVVDDRGAHYPITVDPIAQQAYLKASNSAASDYFGLSVAVSGDTVVVGAYWEDSNATGVNGNQADNSALESGAAYVFVRNGVNWTQQAYLKASNTGAGDQFGVSVAMSADTIVVGADAEDSNATGVNGNQANNSESGSGAAYVFVRSGTTWTQQAYVKASNTAALDFFGHSVAISGDTMVVGAFAEDSNAVGVNGNQADDTAQASGAAYVFVRTSGNWIPQAYLKASNTGLADRFGYSVSVSGETVVVGAYFEDSATTGVNGNQANESALDSGAAYVFVRSGVTWTQQAYLKASNAESSDFFGFSVGVSGDTVVVGAYLEDSLAVGVNGTQTDTVLRNSGAAYVFARSGSTWSQQAYLKPSNTEGEEFFGWSVAISGNTVAVGAVGERGISPGVNGNQFATGAPSSGAVYVFGRSGVVWTQLAYVKASNPGSGDQFGLSVAAAGDTVIAGATGEASGASGVNGGQADNSRAFSGAAYVFGGFPAEYAVTITSSPTGQFFSSTGSGCAPGSGYTTPQILFWTAGSPCSVTFVTPQSPAFVRWEDNSINATRSITAPAVNSTYTAIFAYQLTLAASPTAGGTVVPGGVYTPGVPMSVLATALPGYAFSNWSGACTGSGACNVLLDAPKSVIGNFIPISSFLTVLQTGPLAVVGPTQTLLFRFTHTSGFGQLGVVNALINRSLDGAAACYIAYSQPDQVLYLVNDLGPANGLSAALVLGSSASVSNSQCTISGTGSSAVGSGNTLTLTLNVTYKTPFLGNKVIYTAARDQPGNSTGWSTVGATIVGETSLTFPRSGTMTPSVGTTSTAILSFTYSDATSAANLQTAWALMNNAIDARQACYVAYYAPGNILFLFPDNGDGNAATNIVLTGTNTIENSQCRISAQGSSVTTNGGQLTLNLNYTFKAPFAGFRAIWTATQNLAGTQTSVWKPVGGCLVP